MVSLNAAPSFISIFAVNFVGRVPFAGFAAEVIFFGRDTSGTALNLKCVNPVRQRGIASVTGLSVTDYTG